MLNSVKIGMRLALGFTTILVMILVMGIFAYSKMVLLSGIAENFLSTLIRCEANWVMRKLISLECIAA